jgi:SAM-dependent methyltransferase
MKWIENLFRRISSVSVPFIYLYAGAFKAYDRFYDDSAEFYVSQYAAHKKDDIPLYLSLAGKAGSPILDAACGSGRVAIRLAQAGHTVFGFDSSNTMLKYCAQSLQSLHSDERERVHLVRSEMQNIPFKSHFKLGIIAYNSFNHLLSENQQRACLNGMYAALKKDGLLVMEILPYHGFYDPAIRIRKNDLLSDGKSNIAAYSRVKHDRSKNHHTVYWYISVKRPGGQTRRIVSKFIRKDIPLSLIKRLIVQSGFVLEEIRDSYSEISSTNKKQIIIARKN